MFLDQHENINNFKRINEIWNESLEELGLLARGVSGRIKNEAKEQNGGFRRTLLGTLAASILGNMLADKLKIPEGKVIRAAEGVIWAGEGTIRASQDI